MASQLLCVPVMQFRPVQPYRPAGRLCCTNQMPHQCGFTRPAWPYHRQHFALVHRKRDPFEQGRLRAGSPCFGTGCCGDKALNPQIAFWLWQLHAVFFVVQIAEDIDQTFVGLTGRNKLLPLPHGLFDRGQCAAHHDRGGDHNTRRDFL